MSFDRIHLGENRFKDGSRIIIETGKNNPVKGYAYKQTKNNSYSVDARLLPDGRTMFHVSKNENGKALSTSAFVLNKAGTRLNRMKNSGDIFWRIPSVQTPPKNYFDILRKIFKGKVKI